MFTSLYNFHKMKYINFVNSCVPCMWPGSNGWGRCTYCPGRSTGIVIWVDLLLSLIGIGSDICWDLACAYNPHLPMRTCRTSSLWRLGLGNWGGMKIWEWNQEFHLGVVSVTSSIWCENTLKFFHGCPWFLWKRFSCHVARHSFL